MRLGIWSWAVETRHVFAVAAVGLVLSACTYVPLRQRAAFRKQQYFAAHREVEPATAKAIDTGHVILGMDTEQVWVVLGDPLRKKAFSSGTVEVWLFSSTRLHQDPMHSHGAESFRLVFMNGRLVIIEPI